MVREMSVVFGGFLMEIEAVSYMFELEQEQLLKSAQDLCRNCPL